MKKLLLLSLLILPLVALADTPPPGTVKAKTYSGDGNTAITATGTALNVNVINSAGLSTVNQGTAGIDPWFVSVRDSALPTNACQETGGNLAAILSKLQASVAVTGTFWQATQPVSGTFWQTTQPVSVASLPLPADAASETTLAAINTKTPALGQALAAGSVPVVLTASQLSTLTPFSTVTANAGTGTFSVDGSGHTQPVSGTFWQATQPVSLASVPLASGAALESTQLDVKTNTGATATSAASIDTKTPALGQALAAGSVPVVLPAAQISTLTPLSTITANAGSGTFTVNGSGFTQPVSGTFWQATQPVSGTVTANIGTSGSLALDSTVAGLQVTQGSTTSGQSGSLALGAVTTAAPSYTTAQSSPFSLTTAGALRIDGSASTQPVSGTFWQATQPVSGTFWQTTQPVSLATLPALTAGSALIGHVIVDTAPTTAVTGTFWQATQPVSIATAPALVASSAIIGKVGIDQTTPGTTNGVQVNAALPAGSNVIGHVIVDTAPSTAVTNAGTFAVQSTPVVPTAVTVKQAAITVGTSAVRLTTDGSAPSATRVLLVAQLIATSTATCFFGSSGVTSSSTGRGVQMLAGQTFSFNRDAGDYYAICDTASQTFLVTEQE